MNEDKEDIENILDITDLIINIPKKHEYPIELKSLKIKPETEIIMSNVFQNEGYLLGRKLLEEKGTDIKSMKLLLHFITKELFLYFDKLPIDLKTLYYNDFQEFKTQQIKLLHTLTLIERKKLNKKHKIE